MLGRIVNSIAGWFQRTFPAHKGWSHVWPYLLAAAVLSLVVFFLLQQLKPRGRRAVIAAVTFLAGLFYALEFFLPVQMVKGQEQNALTPFLPVASDFNQIIATFALGLGIYTLAGLHGRNILRARQGWGFSIVFWVSMIAIVVMGYLSWAAGYKNMTSNQNIKDILYIGGLQALDATMFSIIAFYIASAAYRAFRVRNAEASLLMGAAFIVMMGQVYAGQWVTHWLPAGGPLSNLRVETMSDWLLTRVNAPAVRAVGFGLGVGLLATALRIWLSLERGSYFDREV